MGLDVWLKYPQSEPGGSVTRIFIREDGATKEVSRTEWDRRFPGQEPVTVESENSGEVYSGNITHNLAPMAEAAGIYQHLWRPDEIGVTHARQLVEPLTAGLAQLQSDPSKFKGFNAPNGWGKYENLVTLVADYLEACREHPDAEVNVWR